MRQLWTVLAVLFALGFGFGFGRHWPAKQPRGWWCEQGFWNCHPALSGPPPAKWLYLVEVRCSAQGRCYGDERECELHNDGQSCDRN